MLNPTHSPRRTTLAALLAFAGLAGCLADGTAAHGPGGADAVLAVVDGERVPASEYRSWLADVYGPAPREDYLALWLLEREARRRGVVVGTAEIDAARETLLEKWTRERCAGDAARLDDEFARQGHDRGSFRRWFHWQKRRELLAQRLILRERTIDEAALRQRFEKEYGPEGVRTKVRLLVLTRARLALELSRQPDTRTPTAAELDQRLRKKAEALRARALAGESFESIVRAESADLAVVKSGGLCRDEDWRLRGAAFVSAVERAPLAVVQPPVVNSSGIDLFEVVARDVTRFEDVRAALASALETEPPSLDEVQALDRRLKDASRIEYPGG